MNGMIQDILIALAVVGTVGLLSGILLAVVSHVFRVRENEKAKALRACLPGVNCGACGFKGCDDYAAALAEGKAKPNLCVPGGAETAREVSAILGTEAEKTEAQVAFVRCNGHCEATGKRAEYSGVNSCRAAAMLYGGPDDCLFGCLGCGDCAAVCPVEAICVKDGIARIDFTRCIGCGLCVKTCPKHIIELIPKKARTVVMCSNHDKGGDARKACRNACIGCRKCQMNCPEKAITVENFLARIDYTKCTGCGICVEKCPANCLKSVLFDPSSGIANPADQPTGTEA